MPGLPTVLGVDKGGGVTRTTPVFTPAANSLILVFGGARRSAAFAPNPFTLDDLGEGLSWSIVTTDFSENTTTTPSFRQTIWQARAPAVPTTMQVTITSDNASHTQLVVAELTSAGLITNSDSTPNNNGDPTATLPNVPAVTSTVISSLFLGSAITFNSVPLDSELYLDTTTNTTLNIRYNDDNGPQNAAWNTSGGNRSIGCVIEIPAAAASGSITESIDLNLLFGRQVQATRGLAVELDLPMTFSISVASNSTPERPSLVWTSSLRTWRSSGTEDKANEGLTFS